MKNLLIFLFCSLSFFCTAQTENAHVTTARDNLEEAFEVDEVSIKLFEEISSVEKNDPLLQGYWGAINFTRCVHVSLFSKMTYFNKGKKILENAIKSDPDNLELHFLRLTLQVNLPKILAYSQHIDADKQFIIQNFENGNDDLQDRILDYANETDVFDSEQKTTLNNL